MSEIYVVTADQRRRCVECGRWEYVENGGVVRHSSRCSHKGDASAFVPQATALASAGEPTMSARKVRQLARLGALGQDKAFDAFRQGLISEDDAMNQDM